MHAVLGLHTPGTRCVVSNTSLSTPLASAAKVATPAQQKQQLGRSIACTLNSQAWLGR
jgi:hypothetical protein